MLDQRTHYKIRVLIEIKCGDDSFHKKEIATAERCVGGRLEFDQIHYRTRQVAATVVDEAEVMMVNHIDYLKEEEAKLQAKIDNNEQC